MKKWLKRIKNKNVSIQVYKKQMEVCDESHQLTIELDRINSEIIDITKGLLNAHSVGFKSKFSKPHNWINEMKNKWYNSAANASAKWHQEKLIILYKQKKEITIKLEKSTGVYWKNKIKRWIQYLILSVVAVIFLITIGIGLLAALYLIPSLILLIVVYMAYKKFWERKKFI